MERRRVARETIAEIDGLLGALVTGYGMSVQRIERALRQCGLEPIITALCEARVGTRPSKENLTRLQQLAAQSIGTKDVNRQRGLMLEQKQMMKELKLLQAHLEELDTEICHIVEHSREGQILLSMLVIGPIEATAIISAIGYIENFASAAALKSYFGWAPKREQTGISDDRASLTYAGTRTMRQMMFLVVANAIQMESEWTKKYKCLVPIKCGYDERTRSYKGKVKVFGRIAGQMIEMIYAFLKKDAEILSKVPLGVEPPQPTLYDPEVHKRHREGQYRSLKPGTQPRKIIQLPKQS